MEIRERIKKIRLDSNMKQKDFAQTIKISRGNLSNIEIGKVKPTDRVISDICTRFNISENWLRTGEGNIEADSKQTMVNKLTQEYDLTENEARLVYAFSTLDKDRRNDFMEFLQDLVTAFNNAPRPSALTATSKEPAATTKNMFDSDTTAKELHELIDEIYNAKAEEPSA